MNNTLKTVSFRSMKKTSARLPNCYKVVSVQLSKDKSLKIANLKIKLTPLKSIKMLQLVTTAI